MSDCLYNTITMFLDLQLSLRCIESPDSFLPIPWIFPLPASSAVIPTQWSDFSTLQFSDIGPFAESEISIMRSENILVPGSPERAAGHAVIVQDNHFSLPNDKLDVCLTITGLWYFFRLYLHHQCPRSLGCQPSDWNCNIKISWRFWTQQPP